MSDNELIAAFMGLDFKQYQSVSHFEPPKYHDSWDWLMTVVEKINKMHDGDQLTGLDYDTYRSMQDWLISVNIKNAHADLVSIIKWYNAQQK